MAANSGFPSIRELAERTDHLPDDDQPGVHVADDGPTPIEEIESMCMVCGGNGMTRMLLTSIPYFREIIIMSFECNDCGARNNEVQSAGRIQDLGIHYKCEIIRQGDLNRQIVKSNSCTIVLPQWEFTIPPGRGQLTTVEGLLRDAVKDLSMDQPVRKHVDEAAYTKIQSIIDAFLAIVPEDPDNNVQDDVLLSSKFSLELDDPSGNSFVEFYGSMNDPQWHMSQYHRTAEQNESIGLAPDAHAESVPAPEPAAEAGPVHDEEILSFPGHCPGCGLEIDTMMKKVNIPYFKECFIMSTNCDACGYKDNEVKSGAAISDQGKRITLKVVDEEDLSRDILKSETCGLDIPEIDLKLEQGTLGGRFTTLEGIIDQIYEELSSKVYSSEDAVPESSPLRAFLLKLSELKGLKEPFTVILDDPLANSYLQNLYAPDPDPNMTVEMYDRTFEQNEELGLNDIKLEGYEKDADAEAAA
ncbi:zf-ZPR1-domain-containing protein [Exidia glandulosa HHB12029]|uniref:Zf-ZPR1-domain-containing protein n=1 Tax=Exidia glandulosa HHB12029 TaxID=1314781 RepID=A0A165N0D3_EXIGL|nr:zf-ZPR1-domain-containing protein [Exidia glandulosa HHB12029]